MGLAGPAVSYDVFLERLRHVHSYNIMVTGSRVPEPFPRHTFQFNNPTRKFMDQHGIVISRAFASLFFKLQNIRVWDSASIFRTGGPISKNYINYKLFPYAQTSKAKQGVQNGTSI